MNFLVLVIIVLVIGTAYLAFSDAGDFSDVFSISSSETKIKSSSSPITGATRKSGLPVIFDFSALDSEIRDAGDSDRNKEGVGEGPVDLKDDKPKVTPPNGFTAGELSPFYGQVDISSFVKPRLPDNGGSFRLYMRKGEESLNVTGWILKGNKGNRVIIPQAIDDYNPGYYRSGDIWMVRGEYVYVYSNESGFGKNIRLNDCTGYLNNSYEFDPSLPKQCPRVNRDDIVTFSGECQSYLRLLGACEEPTDDDMRQFLGDSECVSYIRNRFSYGNCYREYGDGDGFFDRSWYVWVDKSVPFDPLHDRILLLDRDGLLVDVYTY